jgi:hypothetical protein
VIKRKRRAVVLVLAVAVAGGFLALAPTPSFSVTRGMKVDTETPPTVAAQTAADVRSLVSSDGVVARHEGVSQFRMLGVGWDDNTQRTVRVRTMSNEKWSDWKSLETEQGPDSNSREGRKATKSVSEPIWVGNADGYEVQVTPPGGPIHVHLVRESGPRVRLQAMAPRAEASAPMPPINTRDSWGARPPKDPPEYASGVQMAFVHHTVNANDYGPGDVPAILRGIQAYHMDSNGWNDIGYNFLVDRFGGIWEGRGGGMDRAVVGAHTLGFNTGSTGVAVIGDFTSANPADASLQGVGQLLAWKFSLNGVDPGGTNVMVSGDSGSKYPQGTSVSLNNISGHKDANYTDCPANLYNFLPQIRTIARSWWGAFFAYGPGFRGGAYIASGEFSGNSNAEVVTGAGPGGGPDVAIFNAHGTGLNRFFAYGGGFGGGVRVATGKVEVPPPSIDDVVTGPGPGGGPDVRVFKGSGTLLNSFFAYGAGFGGGVYVASGKTSALPSDNIVVGPGPGGSPNVRVFTGGGTMLSSFQAYSPGFTGGVRVATGDVDGDGVDEIITAPGPGGGPNVRVFRQNGTLIGNFMPYSPNFTGGVYVGSVRAPDAKRDLIVTGPGEGGGPQVRSFALNGQVFGDFFAGSPDDTTGVRPAGGPYIGSPPGQIAITRGPGDMPLVFYRRLDASAFFP